MAKAERLSDLVMKSMTKMLKHDYQERFVLRFDYAARLRPKKRPAKTADQIRNAMDHFSKALAYAVEFDGKLKFQKKKQPKKLSRAQVRTIIEINLARAKKHFVAGQFYCLRYSIGMRDQDIERLLRSTPKNARHKFEEYRDRLDEQRSKWKAIEPPKNDETERISETRREIKRLDRINFRLDNFVQELDNLLLEIEGIPY